MSTTKIVAITGAAGRIAYSLVPLICDGTLFGKDTRIKLRLIDMETAQNKIEGLLMEIQDSTYDLLDEVIGTTIAKEGFQGANVAILLGGFPRLPGMERKDLIAKNAEGMRDQARALDAYAAKDCKVLIVANPANTNALVAMKFAPSLPPQNFSCLTRLDHERLRGLIAAKLKSTAEHAGLSLKDIRNVGIFGNHSTTQVPFIESATVRLGTDASQPDATQPVKSFFTETEEYALVAQVQTRGAVVMNTQQASSALSAANAIAKHLRDWLYPQDAGELFSMGILSDGNPYGVPDGLVYSFPCQFDAASGSISIVPGLHIGRDTRIRLDLSVEELLQEKRDAEDFVGPLSINTVPSSSSRL